MRTTHASPPSHLSHSHPSHPHPSHQHPSRPSHSPTLRSLAHWYLYSLVPTAATSRPAPWSRGAQTVRVFDDSLVSVLLLNTHTIKHRLYVLSQSTALYLLPYTYLSIGIKTSLYQVSESSNLKILLSIPSLLSSSLSSPLPPLLPALFPRCGE